MKVSIAKMNAAVGKAVDELHGRGLTEAEIVQAAKARVISDLARVEQISSRPHYGTAREAAIQKMIADGVVAEKSTSSAARMIDSVQSGGRNNAAGFSVSDAIAAVAGPFTRPGDPNRGTDESLQDGNQRPVGGADQKRQPLEYGPSLSSSKGEINVESVKAEMKPGRETSKATTTAQAVLHANLTSPALAAASVTSKPIGLPATKRELELEGGKNVSGLDAMRAQMRIDRKRNGGT
jgi:hypothetical protein